MLEKMMGVAERAGHMRTRPGPSDPTMRHARVCYDHLAGEMGVAMFDALVKSRRIAVRGEDVRLTPGGKKFLQEFGIDVAEIDHPRRPMCKSCLDWSQRRSHLAGIAGAAILDRITALKWARRDKHSRAVHFLPEGQRQFAKLFPA
jgi:aminopeptidase-like protein